MSKSKFIEDNKLNPVEASKAGLEAGAASMRIEMNNGVIEVTNGNGAILCQSKNVLAGTWSTLWAILENSGEVIYRA
jgi:hypothetical protein